jgi:hypothetical protein
MFTAFCAFRKGPVGLATLVLALLLMGSRMLVGNVEFRFPLLRPFGVSQRMYGPVPVEVALFADGGVAWNSLSHASLGGILGTPTQPRQFRLKDGVSSAGVALRVNLFGYAVASSTARAHSNGREGAGFFSSIWHRAGTRKAKNASRSRGSARLEGAVDLTNGTAVMYPFIRLYG